jgi:hypothetical protein
MNKDLEINTPVKLSLDTEWNTSDVMNTLNTVGKVIAQEGGWTEVGWGNTDEGLTNSYKAYDTDLNAVDDTEALQTLISFAKEDIEAGRVMPSEDFKDKLAERKAKLLEEK